MKEKYTTCPSCGAEYHVEDMIDFEGQLLCLDCFRENTVLCSHCGERVWSEDNAGTESIPLCQTCYDRYYTSCTHCGALILESTAYYHEDDPYCRDHYFEACRSRGIQNYYYKPEPIFYGDGPRYFGVELEIDDGGEDNDSADELMDIANSGSERIYCKHDGSLEDGFEIVTHPMSLRYHRTEMPWEKVVRKAFQLGYLSHQSGTCGLHVHVSRKAFGDTEAEQDECIARVLYFFEKHWEELLKFSRRTQRQLDQWAARYGYKEQPRDILEHAKKGTHAGRYTCVNLENTNTVEFRIFRGTLKLNTLIATLQLVDRICDVALYLSDDDLCAMSWTTFVSGCTAPELVQYLKERRLYVNEPVTTEEEV